MKKVQFPLLALMGALQGSFVYAEQVPNDLVDINVPMTELGHLLETTLPLIYNDEAFANPANKGLIQDKISQIKNRFKAAEPHISQKSVTYKVSAEVLMNQIDSAESAFARQEVDLTQHILKGLPGVCMSCHLQDHQGNKLFQQLNLDDFESEFSKAEVSFVSRNYEKALTHYKAFLEKPANSNQQLKALERMLVIFSEVYKKPKAIHQQLKYYQSSKKINTSVQKTIGEWIEGLEEYMDESGLVGDGVDYQKLDDYMLQHYTKFENQWVPVLNQQKDKIFYIMLRASLYDYLNESPPANVVPAVLYWLAVCDRTLEYSFYFSLADWYLKECVTHYSEHPFAEKCYQAYEDYVTYSYTGSRGTDIPFEVQEELTALKTHLKGKVKPKKTS